MRKMYRGLSLYPEISETLEKASGPAAYVWRCLARGFLIILLFVPALSIGMPAIGKYGENQKDRYFHSSSNHHNLTRQEAGIS